MGDNSGDTIVDEDEKRRRQLIDLLRRLRDTPGNRGDAIPENKQLKTMTRVELEALWAQPTLLSIAPGHIDRDGPEAAPTCPRCGSTWINPPASFGDSVKRGAMAGLVSEVFHVGVIVSPGRTSWTCDKCGYRWMP